VRIGQNPAKFVGEVHKPERITVAVLTYIPFLSGYFATYLDVVKACLSSIWENTEPPYDLMVFDNGSCKELVDGLGALKIVMLMLRSIQSPHQTATYAQRRHSGSTTAVEP